MSQTRRKPNAIDVYVGGRIKRRRILCGMGQAQLASGLGITFQQIQKYESGYNRVGAGRLQTIADILKVDVAYFFEGVRNEDGISEATSGVSDLVDVQAFLTSAEGRQLNQAFTMIQNANVRRGIIDLIESIGIDDAEASLQSIEPVVAP